eukprot:2518509-Rhodomonas_salina.1
MQRGRVAHAPRTEPRASLCKASLVSSYAISGTHMGSIPHVLLAYAFSGTEIRYAATRQTSCYASGAGA